MLNAFRHLTPSFIAYRGVKPGWKFWWRRNSRIIFSSQNQIESLSRPGLLCPISLESIRFRVMRSSKCMVTPGVTHLSFWEQPLVMERHVLHYEYKWTEARRAEKYFLETPPLVPLSQGLDDRAPPYLKFWILHWSLLDVLSTLGLRPQSCMYLVGGYWTYW